MCLEMYNEKANYSFSIIIVKKTSARTIPILCVFSARNIVLSDPIEVTWPPGFCFVKILIVSYGILSTRKAGELFNSATIWKCIPDSQYGSV